MLEAEPQVRELGGQIVVVGNGAVEFLDDFAGSYPDTMVFLTDPEKQAYRALSLRRGMGGMKAFGMVSSGFRAFRAGHRQTKVQGDAMQLGGVFVVAQGGEVAFEQRSKTAGDHASMESVLDVLRSLSVSPSS